MTFKLPSDTRRRCLVYPNIDTLVYISTMSQVSFIAEIIMNFNPKWILIWCLRLRFQSSLGWLRFCIFTAKYKANTNSCHNNGEYRVHN